jgi:hypothetical protein
VVGEGGRGLNTTRQIVWEVAGARGEDDRLESLGGSWRETTQLEQQEWRLQAEMPWRRITVVRFWARPGSQAAASQVHGSGFPTLSCQLPPPPGCEERRWFDVAKVEGWDDDGFGVYKPARTLDWQAMHRKGFSEEVVREAREGLQGEFARPLEQYIFGGEHGGHYASTVLKRGSLVKVEEEVMMKTPAGGEATEGPMNCRPWVTAPYHAVPKLKNGEETFRLARDHAATGANECLQPQVCRMPTLDDFFSLLSCDGWILKRDGSNAFMHHPVGTSMANAFGFVALNDGSFRRARSMDFGTRIAPAACMRFAWDCARLLSIASVFGIIFMDDWCVAAGDEAEVARAKQVIDDLAKDILYVFNPDKELIAQKMTILGIDTDTRGHGCASLPEEKIAKYVQSIDVWLETGEGTMQSLAALAGRLNFAAPWIRTSAARLTPLFACLYGDFRLEEEMEEEHRLGVSWRHITFSDRGQEEVRRDGWPRMVLRGLVKEVWVHPGALWQPDRAVYLSHSARAALQWWKANIRTRNGVSLHLDCPHHKGRWSQQTHFGDHNLLDARQMTVGGARVITTDAAKETSLVCGGWMAGDVTGTVDFVGRDRHAAIHMLELDTAIRAIKLLAPLLATPEERRILLRSDNSVTVACISRGNSRVEELNDRVRDLADFLEQEQLELRAIYIRSERNNCADDLSRKTKVPSSQSTALASWAKDWLEQHSDWPREGVGDNVFPGGEWESVATVVARRQRARLASWKEICERGSSLLVPLFDEVGEALAGAALRGAGTRCVAVLVPNSMKARQQSWWRRFRALASCRISLPQGAAAVKLARAKWISSDPCEWGEWLDGAVEQMEMWLFLREEHGKREGGGSRE